MDSIIFILAILYFCYALYWSTIIYHFIKTELDIVGKLLGM